MKALIAATDEIRQKTKESLFSKSQWYVLEVENETDLMSGLRAERPDLLVLDAESIDITPVFDQINLLESTTKVLFLLGSEMLNTSRLIRSYLKAGNSDYLTKPIDTELLSHRISSLITSLKQKSLPEGLSKKAADVHDEVSGRISAKKVANFLGISLKSFAGILDKNYRALHKTPHSETIQADLLVYRQIIEILSTLFRQQEDIAVWLNSPCVDFGNRTPVSLILEGHAAAVLELLKDVQEGAAV